MPHAYTEDQLVEQPALGLFAVLGWAVAGPPPNAGVAGEPRDAGLLGRETKGEVVLIPRLRSALEKLNAKLPPEAFTVAISGIGRVSPPPVKWPVSVKSPAKRPDMKADAKRDKNLAPFP